MESIDSPLSVSYSASIDLIVVSVTVFEIFDIKAIFSIGCKPKSELNRKQIDAHARLLLPVLLAIELTLRCQLCDLHFKFEEDRKKLRSLSRAIGTLDGQTDRQTNKHSSDFYICPVP